MKKFFTTLLIIILIEIFSLIILISIDVVDKFLIKNVLHAKQFSIYDLPHPILNKFIFKKDSRWKNLYDPNTTLYMDKYRFGKDRLINIKKNNFHIYLVGGSTVEGDGVDKEEKTIAFNLEKMINQKLNCQNKIKVFNEGISGNASKLDFLNISLRILKYQKPDLIISLQGGNDFLAYSGTRILNQNLFSEHWYTREQHFIKKIDEDIFIKIFTYFFNNTYFGKLISAVIYSINPEIYWFKGGYKMIKDKGILHENYKYFQNLSYEITKSNDVDYYHFLQPILSLKKNKSLNEMNTFHGKKYTTTFSGIPNQVFSKKFWEDYTEFYYKILLDLEITQNDWFFDFSQIFENSNDDDFYDHIHLSENGQNKIAFKISEKISNNNRLINFCSF